MSIDFDGHQRMLPPPRNGGRCTCGHIDQSQPGTYYCDNHGRIIVTPEETK